MYLKVIDKADLFFENIHTPTYVYISISNKCNANCIFCNVHQEIYKDNIVNLSEIIKQLNLLGTRHIHFIGGGEPFVNTEIWDCLEEISNTKMKVSFTTNGALLDEKAISVLKKCKLGNLFVSIDGHTPELHNSLRRTPNIWEKSTYNIRKFKETFPNVNVIINHVLNRENIDYIEDMICLKEKVPFDYLNLIFVKDCTELSITDEQMKIFINKKDKITSLAKHVGVDFLSDVFIDCKQTCSKNMPCYFPQYSMYIDCTSGSVYPCDCTVHRDSNYYSCGNLLNESLLNIWNGEKMCDLRKRLSKGSEICNFQCDSSNKLFNDFVMKLKSI